MKDSSCLCLATVLQNDNDRPHLYCLATGQVAPPPTRPQSGRMMQPPQALRALLKAKAIAPAEQSVGIKEA